MLRLLSNSLEQLEFYFHQECKATTIIANSMTDILSNYSVTDRQTFIKFLDLLRQDLLGNPKNWENKTLEDFLEALSAYANDIQGYYDIMNSNVNADTASWQTIADIFKGATMYE